MHATYSSCFGAQFQTVGVPLFKAMVGLFLKAQPMLDGVLDNLHYWEAAAAKTAAWLFTFRRTESFEKHCPYSESAAALHANACLSVCIFSLSSHGQLNTITFNSGLLGHDTSRHLSQPITVKCGGQHFLYRKQVDLSFSVCMIK